MGNASAPPIFDTDNLKRFTFKELIGKTLLISHIQDNAGAVLIVGVEIPIGIIYVLEEED